MFSWRKSHVAGSILPWWMHACADSRVSDAHNFLFVLVGVSSFSSTSSFLFTAFMALFLCGEVVSDTMMVIILVCCL